MSNSYALLSAVALLVVFWLFVVRPQSRRQRELAHLQLTLEVGDEVMLTSGVYGTLRGLDEDVAQVEIADGVTIRVARGAVGQVLRETDTPADEEEVSEEN